MNFPPLVTMQKSSDFMNIKLKSKGRKQHEQLYLGLPADFLMSISSFSVLFLFFSPRYISLLFYYVSLLILISLWYVYYVYTLQLCWFPGFHQATGSLLSRVSPSPFLFRIYNLIQLRVWCQFYFSTLFRSYTTVSRAFSSQVSTVAWWAPAHERKRSRSVIKLQPETETDGTAESLSYMYISNVKPLIKFSLSLSRKSFFFVLAFFLPGGTRRIPNNFWTKW